MPIHFYSAPPGIESLICHLMDLSGGGGGGGLAYVVIQICAIILDTFLGCSGILGVIFLVKFSLSRNHSDFWVLIWIFNPIWTGGGAKWPP